jgi:hypothetical protein
MQHTESIFPLHQSHIDKNSTRKRRNSDTIIVNQINLTQINEITMESYMAIPSKTNSLPLKAIADER